MTKRMMMKKKTQTLNSEIFPNSLGQKLTQRKKDGSLRSLKSKQPGLVDFSSNDYLGFSRHKLIAELTTDKINAYSHHLSGATGSRLLTGNYKMIEDFENYLADYYHTESSTVFNSGYDANLGLISSIVQRKDLILYDELCHASIRDGITLSNAKSYKFRHNDLVDLEQKLNKFKKQFDTVYVITEHVFSMDGDQADVDAVADLCTRNKAYFILDEAHSVGVTSKKGCLELKTSFARIVTFGKSFGSHGAVVLGSNLLKDYLINFAKSFIYTTAPGIENTARNWAAHHYMNSSSVEFEALKSNINSFRTQIKEKQLTPYFIESTSAIQSCVIGGNDKVKLISEQLQLKGYDVRPILSPTVGMGKERLRFCLHSFNSESEIEECLNFLYSSLKI